MNLADQPRKKFTPFPYQERMIDWLIDNKNAALFCSPGLGKTVCTLKAWHTLYRDCESKGMLVIAPIRVCLLTWPAEVAKWDFCEGLVIANLRTAEGIRHWEKGTADIYVINSEALPTREIRVTCPTCQDGKKTKREDCDTCMGEGQEMRKYPGFVSKHIKGRKPHQLPVDYLMIDELSLAKSARSKRFNALRVWRGHFKRIAGLTGTPAPNSYLDLWAQIRFLDDGERFGLTQAGYHRAYFQAAGRDMFAKLQLKPGAKEAIEAKISDICLTMLSEDYLDVPTCNFEDIEVTLNPKARREYVTMKKELLLEIESGEIEALNAAALTNKLLQITSGQVYDAERNVHVLHDAKVKALKGLIKKHKGEPVLVLTQFKHERARLLEEIPEARRFHERDLGEWQAGKIPVWIADSKSVSHGIDGMQHGGRIVIWVTLTYSNETYTQANARLVRTGQSYETIVYRLIASDTVDEAVVEALKVKDDQQNGLFAALKNLQLLEQSSKQKKAS